METLEVLPDMADNSESIVLFSAKELFLQVNGKLDIILVEMGKKADKVDLERLRDQVAHLETNGTLHAQNALRLAAELDSRLDKMNLNVASTKAVAETREHIRKQDARMRIMIAGIVLTMLGLGAQVAMYLLHLK